MKTGFRGTFVISWSQAETDGLIGAPIGAIDVGSTWRWTGRAVRIDDPRDILVLSDKKDADERRWRAERHVHRILGHPATLRLQDPLTGAEDPLFSRGFVLTDGLKRYDAALLDTDASEPKTLLFNGDLPPNNRDLWVVSHNLGRTPHAGPDRFGGVLCFVPGTKIRVENGSVPVEQINPGDFVQTKDSGLQQVQWIGRRRISGARLTAMPDLRAVRMRSGFFGEGEPNPDLLLSPDHRVVLRGAAAQDLFGESEVLVSARDLVDDRNVRTVMSGGEVTYIHLMLQRHQIVWANGVECETFHPDGASLKHLDEDQKRSLCQVAPTVLDDPAQFGDFARRVLNRAEAALVTYGNAQPH